MFETLFASIAAKITAAGVAVAMASTGAVAATGNLPDQWQTGLSQAVESIGIDIPLGETAALEQAALEADLNAAADGDVDGELDVDADVEVDVDSDDAEGEPNENADFGQSVAADAQDGGVDGQQISERAQEMADERKAAGQANRPESVPAGPETAEQYKPSGTPGPGTADQYKPSGTPGPGTADQYKPSGTPGGRP